MSLTLHYGGVGRAFVVADDAVENLLGDIKRLVEEGGDWYPLPLRRGDLITIWFGPGIAMYVTETDDDDRQEGPGWAEVLDLEPTREPIAPRFAGRSVPVYRDND